MYMIDLHSVPVIENFIIFCDMRRYTIDVFALDRAGSTGC